MIVNEKETEKQGRNKLPLWEKEWDEAETAWDARARAAAERHPLKTLNQLPHMAGITEETAKHLKWKSLKWMATRDHKGEVWKGFLQHPFKYGWELLKSSFKTKSFKREGDFFLYGLDSIEALKKKLRTPDVRLVLGFSYCQKPFECPSGRFSPACIRDTENPVCQQCFIGKCFHAAPQEKTLFLCIPTIHYIGGKIFELLETTPADKIVFLITACELTLEMFGDWGNMAGVRGAGIRLDGRICNTMKAFELSEAGIKPGLTLLLRSTERQLLDLLKQTSMR